MIRPESPKGMSDTGKACDVLALDCIEALEVLWKELAILDELGRVQGVRDPYSEAEALEDVWRTQQVARDALQSARDALVGARNRVASRTGLSAERRAEVKRLMTDENISEKSSHEGCNGSDTGVESSYGYEPNPRRSTDQEG